MLSTRCNLIINIDVMDERSLEKVTSSMKTDYFKRNSAKYELRDFLYLYYPVKAKHNDYLDFFESPRRVALIKNQFDGLFIIDLTRWQVLRGPMMDMLKEYIEENHQIRFVLIVSCPTEEVKLFSSFFSEFTFFTLEDLTFKDVNHYTKILEYQFEKCDLDSLHKIVNTLVDSEKFSGSMTVKGFASYLLQNELNPSTDSVDSFLRSKESSKVFKKFGYGGKR